MRSYAPTYKMCGDVCSAESQRDGPIALCWPTRSLTTAISCMGRDPVLPQEAGVSSYNDFLVFACRAHRYCALKSGLRAAMIRIGEEHRFGLRAVPFFPVFS